MKLYLATGNAGKLAELQSLVAAAALQIETHAASALGGMPPVMEDQDTFVGNALKKARALAVLLAGEDWALADDSGLSVDALGGAPGVLSARYAGENATDSDNIERLLEALRDTEASHRGGAFYCYLALVSPRGEEYVFSGDCRGRILTARRGEGGFGYDPIFEPEGFERSFAEMEAAEKARLSHRGKAMRALIDWLKANRY